MYAALCRACSLNVPSANCIPFPCLFTHSASGTFVKFSGSLISQLNCLLKKSASFFAGSLQQTMNSKIIVEMNNFGFTIVDLK